MVLVLWRVFGEEEEGGGCKKSKPYPGIEIGAGFGDFVRVWIFISTILIILFGGIISNYAWIENVRFLFVYCFFSISWTFHNHTTEAASVDSLF